MFFFSINNDDLKSHLVVPKFQNRDSKNFEYKLFSAEIKSGKWVIFSEDQKEDKNFFYIKKIIIIRSIFYLMKMILRNLTKITTAN